LKFVFLFASKAREKLGWKPKTSFAQLVKEMVKADLAIAKGESDSATALIRSG